MFRQKKPWELCSTKNNNTNDETKVPKKRYIFPEERQQINDKFRLVPKKDVYF